MRRPCARAGRRCLAAFAAFACLLGLPGEALAAQWQPGNLNTVLGPVLVAGQSMTGDLVGLGKSFLAFAIVVEFFLLVVGYLIESGVQESMSGMASLIMRASIPAYLLASWPAPLVHAEGFFSQQVFSAFGIGSVSTMLGSALTQLMHSFGGFVVSFPQSHLLTAKVWDIPARAYIYIGKVFDVLFFDSMVLFFVGGACVLLLVGFFFALYGPIIFITLGLVFGPILVCWLPFRPLRWIARSWAMFMAASMVALIVGAALVSILITAIGAIANQFASVVAGSHGAIPALQALVVFMVPTVAIVLFMAHLVFGFEHIAEGLTGGATSSSHNAARTMGRVAGIGGRVVAGMN